MQTNIKYDDEPSRRSVRASNWIFESRLVEKSRPKGEIGVIAGESNVPPNLIDVNTYLSGRDQKLNRYAPTEEPKAAKPIESVAPMATKSYSDEDLSMLSPKYTKELKSSRMNGEIEFNRWIKLPTNPQEPVHIIENVANTRNGMDTRNFIKSAWSNQNNSKGYDRNICRATLSKSRLEALGAPKGSGDVHMANQRSSDPNHPFIGITRQQLRSVGAVP